MKRLAIVAFVVGCGGDPFAAAEPLRLVRSDAGVDGAASAAGAALDAAPDLGVDVVASEADPGDDANGGAAGANGGAAGDVGGAAGAAGANGGAGGDGGAGGAAGAATGGTGGALTGGAAGDVGGAAGEVGGTGGSLPEAGPEPQPEAGPEPQPEAGPEPVVEACTPDKCIYHAGYYCGWLDDGCGGEAFCGQAYARGSSYDDNACGGFTMPKYSWVCGVYVNPGEPGPEPMPGCVYYGVSMWCCPSDTLPKH